MSWFDFRDIFVEFNNAKELFYDLINWGIHVYNLALAETKLYLSQLRFLMYKK